MKVLRTELEGVLLIEPDVFSDARGFFLETYNRQKYDAHGFNVEFVQDNYSRSIRGTLRGLHAQRRRPQGKLIRVINGSIFDVAVDIRRGSRTYGNWFATTLSAENFRQCYVPPGYAHGFCVLSEIADVEYKCTDFYDPSDELHIAWNDPDFGVQWPTTNPLLSEKDRAGQRACEISAQLPVIIGKKNENSNCGRQGSVGSRTGTRT
jgi:dTDP-4-dehydrorhamnose 3,5-epimerase